MAIIDEETDMLRAILEDKIPPIDILKEANKEKRLRLNSSQETVLKRASASDYSELDISILYSLIRNICTSIPPPTNGWGEDPDVHDVTIGDDIERIRTMRNELYGHASVAQMSDADFQTHFNNITDIGKRMDKYFSSINKTTSYEKKLKVIETKVLDDGTVQQYIKKIKDMEEREKELKKMVLAYARIYSRYL
jgi:hypothetical protein